MNFNRRRRNLAIYNKTFEFNFEPENTLTHLFRHCLTVFKGIDSDWNASRLCHFLIAFFDLSLHIITPFSRNFFFSRINRLITALHDFLDRTSNDFKYTCLLKNLQKLFHTVFRLIFKKRIWNFLTHKCYECKELTNREYMNEYSFETRSKKVSLNRFANSCKTLLVLLS